MPIFVTIAFFAVLVVCTFLAVRMWFKQKDADVSAAEQRVFKRFVLGLMIFWLLAIAAYVWGPLHPVAG